MAKIIYKERCEGMAKIIYKEGCDGQNRLESIEGIEIKMLNGQKALIYPKYAEKEMLKKGDESKCDVNFVSEIEALKKKDSNWATGALLRCGSPAAEFVSNFHSDRHGIFGLPTLLAAMEIQDQKKDIDALAETIKGADILRDFTSGVWSCSRCNSVGGWFAYGYGGFFGPHQFFGREPFGPPNGGFAGINYLYGRNLCVPTILKSE